MTRQRTPCRDGSWAAAIALVALALGGCPPKPGPEPMEPPSNEPMTGPGNDGALVPAPTAPGADPPSPDPNEPSPSPGEPAPTPGPPAPPPPPGAVDPTRPQ